MAKYLDSPFTFDTPNYFKIIILKSQFFRKPVIDIAAANPKLFAVVQELVEVAQMRSNIMLMKKYLTVCRIASEEKLLLNLVSRQHFVDGPNLYSMQDLMDVKNGTLLPYLQRITGNIIKTTSQWSKIRKKCNLE